MAFKEGEKAVVVGSMYKCPVCGGNHGGYYHGEKFSELELLSKGKIIRVLSKDKLLFRLEDGSEWQLHPDELEIIDEKQMKGLTKLIRGIKDIPRHLVFEIAQETPVFLVDGKVYSLGEDISENENNFYENRKNERRPLIDLGDFDSLDSILLDRARPHIKRIEESYIREIHKQQKAFEKIEDNLDTPQLIFKKVFPYIHNGAYEDKVSELLGVEKKETIKRESKQDVTQRLEKIADEIDAEIKGLIREIEEEGEDIPIRNKKQSKLDDLLDYKPESFEGDSILGKASNGLNLAILDNKISILEAYKIDNSLGIVHLNGQTLRLNRTNKKVEDLENNLLHEFGKRIKINALKENLSRDKIIDILRTQDLELLQMAGKKEYERDGFGFIHKDGDYYVYINVPKFAIKSGFDKNYYLFDETRIGILVSGFNNSLNYGDIVLIDNNDHPLLGNYVNYDYSCRRRFARPCIGTNNLPTGGRNIGDVIAKRLFKMREIMKHGIRTGHNPHNPNDEHVLLKTCSICGINHYEKHIITENQAKKMNIPIYDQNLKRREEWQ